MISITCTGPPGDFCHSGVIKKPIRQISVQLLYVSYSDTNADWRKCSSSCLIWQTRIFREQSHIIKALFQNIIILTKIISLLLNLLPYSRNYPSANMHQSEYKKYVRSTRPLVMQFIMYMLCTIIIVYIYNIVYIVLCQIAFYRTFENVVSNWSKSDKKVNDIYNFNFFINFIESNGERNNFGGCVLRFLP